MQLGFASNFWEPHVGACGAGAGPSHPASKPLITFGAGRLPSTRHARIRRAGSLRATSLGSLALAAVALYKLLARRPAAWDTRFRWRRGGEAFVKD